MLLVVDGPEKAGKTTFCRNLAEELGFVYQHWGKPESARGWLDPAYSRVLQEHIYEEHPVVWDRSWASDWVYGNLANRPNPVRDDPWLMEWYHGRAVQAAGHRLILLGPGGEEQFGNRTPDDQKVDPHTERELYRVYGNRFGWEVVTNDYSNLDVAVLTDCAKRWVAEETKAPPMWAGPPDAEVIVLGEALSPQAGGVKWLPFTSEYTTRLGRLLGDDAFRVAWTNAATEPGDDLKQAQLVVCCGAAALEYAQGYTANTLAIPHPAWLYRWGKAARVIQDHETVFVRGVKEVLANVDR